MFKRRPCESYCWRCLLSTTKAIVPAKMTGKTGLMYLHYLLTSSLFSSPAKQHHLYLYHGISFRMSGCPLKQEATENSRNLHKKISRSWPVFTRNVCFLKQPFHHIPPYSTIFIHIPPINPPFISIPSFLTCSSSKSMAKQRSNSKGDWTSSLSLSGSNFHNVSN